MTQSSATRSLMYALLAAALTVVLYALLQLVASQRAAEAEELHRIQRLLQQERERLQEICPSSLLSVLPSLTSHTGNGFAVAIARQNRRRPLSTDPSSSVDTETSL